MKFPAIRRHAIIEHVRLSGLYDLQAEPGETCNPCRTGISQSLFRTSLRFADILEMVREVRQIETYCRRHATRRWRPGNSI